MCRLLQAVSGRGGPSKRPSLRLWVPSWSSRRQVAAAEPGPAATFITYSGRFKTIYAIAEPTADPRGIPGDAPTTTITRNAKAAVSAHDLANGISAHWH